MCSRGCVTRGYSIGVGCTGCSGGSRPPVAWSQGVLVGITTGARQEDRWLETDLDMSRIASRQPVVTRSDPPNRSKSRGNKWGAGGTRICRFRHRGIPCGGVRGDIWGAVWAVFYLHYSIQNRKQATGCNSQHPLFHIPHGTTPLVPSLAYILKSSRSSRRSVGALDLYIFFHESFLAGLQTDCNSCCVQEYPLAVRSTS